MKKVVLKISVLIEDEHDIDGIINGVEDWVQSSRQSAVGIHHNEIISVEEED